MDFYKKIHILGKKILKKKIFRHSGAKYIPFKIRNTKFVQYEKTIIILHIVIVVFLEKKKFTKTTVFAYFLFIF